MAISIPFSIVRFFQSRIVDLTGTELDLLNSPQKALELNKAKLLYQYCEGDLPLVMKVINQALQDSYVLEHPTLAIVHSKAEQLLFALRQEAGNSGGWVKRKPVEEQSDGGYLGRDYQRKRRIVL